MDPDMTCLYAKHSLRQQVSWISLHPQASASTPGRSYSEASTISGAKEILEPSFGYEYLGAKQP